MNWVTLIQQLPTDPSPYVLLIAWTLIVLAPFVVAALWITRTKWPSATPGVAVGCAAVLVASMLPVPAHDFHGVDGIVRGSSSIGITTEHGGVEFAGDCEVTAERVDRNRTLVHFAAQGASQVCSFSSNTGRLWEGPPGAWLANHTAHVESGVIAVVEYVGTCPQAPVVLPLFSLASTFGAGCERTTRVGCPLSSPEGVTGWVNLTENNDLCG